ncbi:unnamed protein product [Spirodela intermedia]|uniref:Zeta toxin domain-containing protein n=1 Tax=Spirodela intermedia TaxID=51605 RepID=A0A7I8IMD7_SPIIN|nr:unnamed protein product [Spirodela intermedia]CAA6659006.1 unnamed protein product [Spirodela intermedia]
MSKDGITGHVLLGISAASVVILAAGVAAAAARIRRERSRRPLEKKPIPRLVRRDSGLVVKLESFSDYVARQVGFGDSSQCPRLGKLANDYLRKAKDCEENIFAFFVSSPDPESLHAKLVDELDRCILGYFAFHWSHTTLMIRQVLAAESEQKEKKLKSFVMEATRKMRFERVTRDLKVTRVFFTLTEEMKVMVPAALSERSPVLLLMGGGMGAGKSTVLKDILQESFWAGGAGSNAVVVEADAFKESDVIYRALSSRGDHHDILQTAELVHQSSTDAASSLLVTALNEGRDVIMDGTLSWEPFVEQTIACVQDDGSVIENYWEQVAEEEEDNCGGDQRRKPYRIELVGVVCDTYLAVVRGIRSRAILTKRAVRVKSQLKSHRSFARAFPKYCQLVDNARLYCTNVMAAPPQRLADRPREIGCLHRVAALNDDADNACELYAPLGGLPSVLADAVLSPSRAAVQEDIRTAVEKIENQ